MFARPLTFLAVVSLASACLSVHHRAVLGTWQDADSGPTYTFEKQGSSATLTRITDRDGEAFEILDAEVSGRGVSFTYRVPSTEYVVTCTNTEGVRGGAIAYAWTSASPDQQTRHGEETMLRVAAE